MIKMIVFDVGGILIDLDLEKGRQIPACWHGAIQGRVSVETGGKFRP